MGPTERSITIPLKTTTHTQAHTHSCHLTTALRSVVCLDPGGWEMLDMYSARCREPYNESVGDHCSNASPPSKKTSWRVTLDIFTKIKWTDNQISQQQQKNQSNDLLLQEILFTKHFKSWPFYFHIEWGGRCFIMKLNCANKINSKSPRIRNLIFYSCYVGCKDLLSLSKPFPVLQCFVAAGSGTS